MTGPNPPGLVLEVHSDKSVTFTSHPYQDAHQTPVLTFIAMNGNTLTIDGETGTVTAGNGYGHNAS